MAPEQPSWWQKRRRRRVIIGIIIACAIIALIFAGYWYWDWTGFGGKTLWDWLTLLGVLAVPAMVSLATIWFTERQSQTSEAANKQQDDRSVRESQVTRGRNSTGWVKAHRSGAFSPDTNQRIKTIERLKDYSWRTTS